MANPTSVEVEGQRPWQRSLNALVTFLSGRNPDGTVHSSGVSVQGTAAVAVQNRPVTRGVHANDASTATVGVKLSYVVPVGVTAWLRGATAHHNVGAPTVQLQVVRAGSVIVLATGTFTGSMALEPGDTAQWNVTVAAAAGSTSDFTLSIEEA